MKSFSRRTREIELGMLESTSDPSRYANPIVPPESALAQFGSKPTDRVIIRALSPINDFGRLQQRCSRFKTQRTTKMTSHIKLYGSKSDRFEKIKEKMADQLGYEPSNPEVVGLVMAAYETDENETLQIDNARL